MDYVALTNWSKLYHIDMCFYINRLPRMFLSTDFLFEKRIEQVTMGLLYIWFTY